MSSWVDEGGIPALHDANRKYAACAVYAQESLPADDWQTMVKKLDEEPILVALG